MTSNRLPILGSHKNTFNGLNIRAYISLLKYAYSIVHFKPEVLYTTKSSKRKRFAMKLQVNSLSDLKRDFCKLKGNS